VHWGNRLLNFARNTLVNKHSLVTHVQFKLHTEPLYFVYGKDNFFSSSPCTNRQIDLGSTQCVIKMETWSPLCGDEGGRDLKDRHLSSVPRICNCSSGNQLCIMYSVFRLTGHTSLTR
jgi:hypothetical protein